MVPYGGCEPRGAIENLNVASETEKLSFKFYLFLI